MNRKQRIKSLLSNYFIDFIIEIIDSSFEHKGHYGFDGDQESHFKLIITNKSKNKQSRLEMHRIINKLLKEEYNTGMHSLEIKIIN